jgi:LCP family protein required for cell wall assembly
MRGAGRSMRTRHPALAAAALLTAATVALAAVAVLRAGSGRAASQPPTLPPGATPIELFAAHGEASLVPALKGERPLFILALGSDARPGQDPLHERSDSIHLIGVNLTTHRATILAFPRDSWVSIPGHGTSKINAAMHDGGPDLTVRTVEQLTGIHIDLWLLTTFDGIKDMVNGIGGLTVDVPYPMHDSFSHANFSKGVHHLGGSGALAFARDRHDVPGGDLSRSRDQGILLVSALTKLRKDFTHDPGELFHWIAVGWRHVKTNLSVATLLQLGLTATQISPGNVNNLVVPAAGGSVGGFSVVFIQPHARSLYSQMRATGVVSHP